jgi:hypothetical protein
MMMDASFTKVSILKDLKTIYRRALEDGNWQVALQATKLRGQHIGMFGKQLLPNVVRIADMTEEQLVEFIDRLETRDPSLKDQEVKPAGENHGPGREPDGQAANLEAPNLQEEAAPEGEHRDSAASASFTPPTRYGLSRRQEEPLDNLYFQKEKPTEGSVLPHPYLEWEKPPPFVWSVF